MLKLAATAATILLAACAPQDQAVGPPIPATIDLAFAGDVAPVLDAEDVGEIVLSRDGTDEPIVVPFVNGATAEFALAPGAYQVTHIGALQCRGMSFQVDPAAGARALGSIGGEIIKTDYYVALMAGAPATAEQVSTLAAAHGLAPDHVDAGAMIVTEQAPCFLHTAGPGQTWRDRPLGEQILFGIGFAAFCAVALASGGFCAS